MINNMVHVHTTAKTISLSGPFSVKNVNGLSIPVTKLAIDAVSYVPDVYVHIDLDGLRKTSGWSDIDHGLFLHDDEVFIDGVMDRLRGIGYQGEAFGRAELGMQESDCIALEPGNDFGDFALSKGWAYTDGLEAYRCNRIIRDVDGDSKIEFEGSGTAFSIRLSPLIQEHSEWTQKKHGGERDAILREVSIPLFLEKSKTEDALLWLREEADWTNVMRLVKIDKQTTPKPKDALAQDPGARFIRQETKGWAYAEGLEAYRCNRTIRDIDGDSKIEFEGSGTAFSIRLSPLIQEHSEWTQKKHGGERDVILREVSIPLFLEKSKTEDALLWLREEADWTNVTRLVKIDKQTTPKPKDALAQDPGARFVRQETKRFSP